MEQSKIRQSNIDIINSELPLQDKYLAEGLSLINDCLKLFDNHIVYGDDNLNQRFSKICGLTVLKGRNLLLGCQSLILDSLGQESGALLRPLIEVIELLQYYLSNPERVNEAIEGELPSAGMIAKEVNGGFHKLREHLNFEASHFRYGVHSISHLVDFQSLTLSIKLNQSKEVLLKNYASLSAFTNILLLNAIDCIRITGVDANDITERSTKWHKEFVSVFPNSPGIGQVG